MCRCSPLARGACTQPSFHMGCSYCRCFRNGDQLCLKTKLKLLSTEIIRSDICTVYVKGNNYFFLKTVTQIYHHHHYPSHQLACRATTQLLHPCLSPANFWMVPQPFMVFISASTVFHQVVFGRPRFRFPSGVRWITTLVMELESLHSTRQIKRHRSLVMMVSIYPLAGTMLRGQG